MVRYATVRTQVPASPATFCPFVGWLPGASFVLLARGFSEFRELFVSLSSTQERCQTATSRSGCLTEAAYRIPLIPTTWFTFVSIPPLASESTVHYLTTSKAISRRGGTPTITRLQESSRTLARGIRRVRSHHADGVLGCDMHHANQTTNNIFFCSGLRRTRVKFSGDVDHRIRS